MQDLIRELAYKQQERYVINNYITNDSEGFVGWRWDKYNVKLKIVSAANRYRDYIVVGVRHHCNMMRSHVTLVGSLIGVSSNMEVEGRKALLKYAGGPDKEEQGFVDQYGTFHDRKQAYKIALKAGQIKEGEVQIKGMLFSEDLY